jgi:uncharacterized protein YdeI (YjbR/CyaY-like superfamily)
MAPAPRSFRTQEDFRAWLERHHASEAELHVRLFKVHARSRGIGHREALDEALCFGWIDGVVRSLDADSYVLRFSPRRPKSNWSAANIKRAKELESAGRMHAAGLTAFRARGAAKPAPYSFEHPPRELEPRMLERLRANRKAWGFWQSEPPGRKRTTCFWVMDAKKPETRERRFRTLLANAARGVPMGILVPKSKRKK